MTTPAKQAKRLRRNTSSDPTGAKLSRKIERTSAKQSRFEPFLGIWSTVREAPPEIEQIIDAMPPPSLGSHVVKAAGIDGEHILLVYWSNPSPSIPLRFFIVPHPLT